MTGEGSATAKEEGRGGFSAGGEEQLQDAPDDDGPWDGAIFLAEITLSPSQPGHCYPSFTKHSFAMLVVTAHLRIEAVLLRSAVVAAAFFLSRSKLKRPWQPWRSLCRLPPSLLPPARPFSAAAVGAYRRARRRRRRRRPTRARS